MNKIACYVIIMLFCVPFIGLSQWQYETFIADTLFPANGYTHGVAVDGENKVWSHSYFTVVSQLVTEAGDTIGVDPLWIMDEDGAPVDSIKYVMLDGEEFPLRNGRGLRADHEGNILATYEDRMFRINHKTFELMDHYQHPNNLALTAPGVDAEGNIYVGTVLAEAPVRVYDVDFNYIMPAITPTGISRTIDVTPDGLTLFYMAPHENAVLKYTRADEFDVFPETPDTILHGMNVTASMVNRATGHLWVNSGLNPNRYEGVETDWTPATFYGYDPATGEVVDHIQWHNLENSYVKVVDGQVVFVDPDEDGAIGPGMRAFAFSDDGNTAYLGQWTIRIVPAIQKFVKKDDAPPIDLPPSQWEYETFIADTMFPANGWTHGIAVDGENKVWSHSYFTVLSSFVTQAGDTIGVDPLWIMDEDGAPVDSIKYVMLDGEEFPLRNGRGLRVDHEGNILATYEDRMFRINHKTFEVMDHYQHPNNLALVAPGVDAEGNIYVGTVLAEAPVRVYDADFNYIMPAITPTGISRTIDVTQDGLTLFYMAPHENAVLKYTRADEFDVFPETPDTILHGMNVTASMVNRATGHLWVNSGLNPNRYEGVETNWTPATFYGYDPATGEVVDHIQWHNLENSYVKVVDGQVVFVDPDEDGAIGPGMRAFAFSDDGNTAYLGQWTIRIVPAIQKFVRKPVSVEPIDNRIAQRFELLQNYPNPFNPSTTIQFALPQQTQVRLEIFNILGQRVKVLVADEVYQAGVHNIVWDGVNELNRMVPSGIYIYRITADDFVASKRMIFLK